MIEKPKVTRIAINWDSPNPELEMPKESEQVGEIIKEEGEEIFDNEEMDDDIDENENDDEEIDLMMD